MDWIHGIIEHTQFPLLTAFLLGLIVALHPCPLATNIAAMGYIARDVANRRRVFLNGLFYTFGRMIAYSVLGMVLIVVLRNGADMLSLGPLVQRVGRASAGSGAHSHRIIFHARPSDPPP